MPGNCRKSMGAELPPIMIYGDDVSHIVTEEGIANLLLCRSPEEREQAIRGVAGFTPVGMARDKAMVENLRDRGIIRRAEDLGIDPRRPRATCSPPVPSRIWCAGPAACTHRLHVSATGDRHGKTQLSI
jgi:hypothetical protein